MKIEMYSKTSCPWCSEAKDWLDARNIPYKLIVLDDIAARNAMYDSFGLEGTQRTVPQIVVDGERIGGYDKLIHSDVEDRFNAGKFTADF